jgi:hypothetical protein
MAKAKDELTALHTATPDAAKLIAEFKSHLYHAFTGQKAADEQAWIDSLKGKDAATVRAAQKQRDEVWARFNSAIAAP